MQHSGTRLEKRLLQPDAEQQGSNMYFHRGKRADHTFMPVGRSSKKQRFVANQAQEVSNETLRNHRCLKISIPTWNQQLALRPRPSPSIANREINFYRDPVSRKLDRQPKG